MFGDIFLEVVFNDFLDESSGEWFVEGEADGAFAGLVGFELVFEGGDACGFGVEADVVFCCGEPDDDAVLFEGGHVVADSLGRLWCCLVDDGAELLEEGLDVWWEVVDVVVDGCDVLSLFFHCQSAVLRRSGCVF